MKARHPIVHIALLVAIASVLALVSNAMASRQRKLVLPGSYPNATRVPQRTAPAIATTTGAPAATIVAPATTTMPASTTAMSPAPGAAPLVIPTATIERPAGQPATTTTPPAPAQIASAHPAPATSVPAAVPPAAPVAKPSVERFQPHPDKAYVEISGDDVVALYAAGALFLDARRTSIYEQGHIAGARSYSVWESDVDDKVNALYAERSDPAEQNQPIVIYCSGGDCEDSHMLAQKLWGVQFNNVYVYKDGFPDWQQRRLPVRTGANP